MKNYLEDEKLTGAQRATLKQCIEHDEELINKINDAKPYCIIS